MHTGPEVAGCKPVLVTFEVKLTVRLSLSDPLPSLRSTRTGTRC